MEARRGKNKVGLGARQGEEWESAVNYRLQLTGVPPAIPGVGAAPKFMMALLEKDL